MAVGFALVGAGCKSKNFSAGVERADRDAGVVSAPESDASIGTGGTSDAGGVGGVVASGGSTGQGGASALAGSSGGISGAAGIVVSGGTSGLLGGAGQGGMSVPGSSGIGSGTQASGGSSTAGSAGQGGTSTPGSGGSSGIATGGAASSGSKTTLATGGTTGTGGVSAPGGAGGASSPGGSSASGGALGSAGTTGTGGASTAGGGSTPGGASGSSSTPIAGAPGNPEGHASIPAEAQPEDVSSPTTVVGTGTPESCTGELFIAAVAKGGVITFNCGPDVATIRLASPAKVFNDKGPKIVIDGGNKIVLSGENLTRILYMNTCDENQVWTSPHCDNQETPQLTVQNLTFANGNSKNETKYAGGGAIYASGGRFKVINSRFVNNVCADTGPDVGGGAIRVFQQYNGLPAYVVNCTFGGASDLANVCSNGGALSSIGVSWTILNSVVSYNEAIGFGGNPADPNTPGGGSGGGIYNDGDEMTLTIGGTIIQYNKVNAYGSAIFFVSNNHTGTIVIDGSTITHNIGGSWYPKYPQISQHDDTPITVTNSTIE